MKSLLAFLKGIPAMMQTAGKFLTLLITRQEIRKPVKEQKAENKTEKLKDKGERKEERRERKKRRRDKRGRFLPD